MGILRTDKISGLETPTVVTGSVNFPGTDDYITAPANTPELLLGNADFTIEGWFYKTGTGQQDAFGLYETSNNRRSYLLTINDSSTLFYYNYTGSSGTSVSTGFTLPLNKWAHVAITRDGTTLKIYVDGKLSGTTTGLTSGAYANTDDQFMIGSSDYSNANSSEWTGHISNLRIVKGYVLYDGDFTAPDHALEVVPGTVLLACNNPDSVTAVESALVGKGLTLTAVNDVAVTSVTPSLTRDFTGGTEFRGVTTFDTQGYFVPPSGTTEQRGRGRGLFAGGYTTVSPGNGTKTIEYLQIQSGGIVKDFGDLSEDRKFSAGLASGTRGVIGGSDGTPSWSTGTMEYVTIATTSNTTSFGNMTNTAGMVSAHSNNTRGLFFSVWDANTSGSSHKKHIDYITIATAANSQDFGELTVQRPEAGGFGSSTRGICAGGYDALSPFNAQDTIDYVTIATTGNATDFGNLTVARQAPGSASSSTRGIIAGGYVGPNSYTNHIDYVTIASTGDATDFGDVTPVSGNQYSTYGSGSSPTRGVFGGGYYAPGVDVKRIAYITLATRGNSETFGNLTDARRDVGGLSSSTRAIFAGGTDGGAPNSNNTIDYVTIATLGDATDFGDLTRKDFHYGGAASSNTRGVFAGGYTPSPTPATETNTMDYVTIATTGNAIDFGDLTLV